MLIGITNGIAFIGKALKASTGPFFITITDVLVRLTRIEYASPMSEHTISASITDVTVTLTEEV